MRSHRIAALSLLSLSCALCAASCLQSPELPANEPGEELGSYDAEPTGEAAQPLLKVFCPKDLHGAACSQMCFARGIPCVYAALHPRKPDEPAGKLYACNSLPPGYMCSYTYENGDTCHFPVGRAGLALCLYTGGVE